MEWNLRIQQQIHYPAEQELRLQLLEFIKEKDQHKIREQAILDSAHTVGSCLRISAIC
jgi:hypothetical protein